jgi:hypothetical protein
MRRFATGWIRTLTAAGFMAIVLSGCGGLPLNAPDLDALGPPAPTSGWSGTPDFITTVPASGPKLPTTGLSASRGINGLLGGSLSCGRFRVSIPAGAFSGTGTVTMTVADTSVAVVALTISPNNLNNFKVPAALSYDPAGLGLMDPVVIYWYDSQRRTWVSLATDVDVATSLPTVYLTHFSNYGAGKAGW